MECFAKGGRVMVSYIGKWPQRYCEQSKSLYRAFLSEMWYLYFILKGTSKVLRKRKMEPQTCLNRVSQIFPWIGIQLHFITENVCFPIDVNAKFQLDYLPLIWWLNKSPPYLATQQIHLECLPFFSHSFSIFFSEKRWKIQRKVKK